MNLPPFIRRIWGTLLQTLFLFKRPMTVGVRIIVHDPEAGTVFLVRHTYVSGWHLPGGGVERGETAMEAVRKELMEEGRLEPRTEPVLLGVLFNRGTRHNHVLLYLSEDCAQISDPEPNWEIAEARAFPLTELPEGMAPATARRIAEWQAGQSPASDW
ncbi:NUDIX domain-containing protein [Notoacmeibacter sp. MSK16QG-6]|uniref:NUDIX domain-containing protein n=1 Tax=Notoacmeibacter sp. MSK16QG-6 TaxID=2957982 RepID=UPI00209F3AD8|nr:NUDIX domain-containing protein [Notoacmeibacter sp. MSK16QG-6]MCP1199905.1 NUDIX domain-containing protein [Notoacmeibacter sp. MSK16QG-6]